MDIRRDKYLKALIDRRHNGMIKVVTGIRRSGKSYLIFHIFRQYLLSQGVREDHIISIELDQRKNRELRDPDTILNYIESCIMDDDMYYILLDEVQLLSEFEEVLNSLLHIDNADVYVTGSNSKFLSKDIITEFRGRGDEIHIFPLTFKEYMQVYEGDVYHGWADYIVYGGLPLTVTMASEQQKTAYLVKLFEETYLKDIIDRHHLKGDIVMDTLVDILSSDTATLTNPTKLANSFVSHSIKTNANTISAYIDYLIDAFIISKAQRYDIKGKKYIGSPFKYYFEDIGLRNARLNFRQIEPTHAMENILYNELIIRGFNVDIGVVEKYSKNSKGQNTVTLLEVDFVCNKGSLRYYVQSAYSIPDANKMEQEQASLDRIDDSFKKVIVVQDNVAPWHNEKGYLIINILDFLLNPSSLEL